MVNASLFRVSVIQCSSGFCIMNVWFLNCSAKYLNPTPTTIAMISLVNMVVQPSCMWETFLRILEDKTLMLFFADTGGEKMGSELKLSIYLCWELVLAVWGFTCFLKIMSYSIQFTHRNLLFECCLKVRHVSRKINVLQANKLFEFVMCCSLYN